MEAKIERMEPLRVAFVRHVGPYEQCGAAWGRLCGWAGPRGLLGPRAQMFGLCHDDPDVTPADKIRYDACLVVGADVAADGPVGVQETVGGDYAVTRHHGAYSGFADTYATLMGQWLPAHGYEPLPGLPSIEFYRNSPDQTPEEQLVTDICVPVRNAKAGRG